jgi:spore maturation protein SpmA
MGEVTQASFESAKSAVTLAIGLIGPMALWLGIMKVVEVAGALRLIARAIKPVTVRLFPDVPPEHPAMSAMIMNFAANALGLGNAATPMGIKAMKELDQLNAEKGTATNAMCLFLAINTSSVTLLPLGVITIRAGAGATNPSSILLPAIFATACSTAVAIVAAKLLSRGSRNPAMPKQEAQRTEEDSQEEQPKSDTISEQLVPPGFVGKALMLTLIVAFLGAIVFRFSRGPLPAFTGPDFLVSLSQWLMPLLICGLLLFGYFRGVKVYEALTDGAKEGFTIAVRIIPYMVAIFVGIGMFRASGALDILNDVLGPLTSLIGMPAEALPMALVRPLSGSGAFGIMSEIVNNNPDSFVSFLVSTMQGSTETTFYVLAVYFGSIGIRRTRHALPAALVADATGILASLFIAHLFWN